MRPRDSGADANRGRHFFVVAAVLALLGVALATALGAALLSISHSPMPHHLAFGYVGPSEGAAQLQKAAGDALDVRTLTGVDQAKSQIRHLQVYGAYLDASTKTQLLIASAASPQVATLLKTLGSRLPGAPTAVDVVPLPRADSGGGSISVLVQITVLAGTIGALGLGRMVPGYRANYARRELPVAFLVLFALAIGLGVTGVASAFGIGTDVGFWSRALTLSMLNLAVTASLSALVALIGSAGSAVGGVLYFLLGLPISGAATALPMLPWGWRHLGQALPPGAAATLLRRVLYFHSAGLRNAITVLAIYAATGLLVLIVLNAVGQVRAHASLAGLP